MNWKLTDSKEEDMSRSDEGQEDYMTYGMVFGMSAGSVGMALCSAFGAVEWGALCISLGMIIGMVIGKSIKKK